MRQLLAGLVALLIVSMDWEAWELWRYPIGAFTPSPNCYQADTLPDLVLPALAIRYLERIDHRLSIPG